MKELKALLIVVVVTGVLYWGIEPYAHSVLHPHVAPANFDFAAEDSDLASSNIKTATADLAQLKASGASAEAIASAEKLVANESANAERIRSFWDEIGKIDLSRGNPKNGAEIAASCNACHSIKAAGLEPAMDDKTASEAYGVVPPDLSDIGYLYDERFLAAVIKDPVSALKLNHKFNDENPFPMTPFFGNGGEINSELADLVAYFKSIAPEKMSDKEVFISACSRCHDMKYDNVFVSGNRQSLASYMGMTPPDLSMYIRSRSHQYLNDFINDTQKMLPGTSMPRVGLNEKAQAQVISYMEQIGDSKKGERESTSLWIMGYFLILGLFAWAWKRKVWSKLH